jgi:hypothetical protein
MQKLSLGKRTKVLETGETKKLTTEREKFSKRTGINTTAISHGVLKCIV